MSPGIRPSSANIFSTLVVFALTGKASVFSPAHSSGCEFCKHYLTLGNWFLENRKFFLFFRIRSVSELEFKRKFFSILMIDDDGEDYELCDPLKVWRGLGDGRDRKRSMISFSP